VKRAAIIVASTIGGLLIGARRLSCKMQTVSDHTHPADDYETTLDSLEKFYNDENEAKIVWWRITQLRKAGFDELRANTIAATGADWRRAVDMVEAGCDHVTAANIVL
jgi:hypothetical protein